MTESEQKILNGFLSKTLKIDSEAMAGLYNGAGELISLDAPAAKDAERISKLKEDSKSQYSRGLKEGAEKIEKAAKSKYEIETDLIGVELIEHIVNEKIAEVKPGDNDITKHPDYLRLKTESDKLLKAKDKEWEKKFADRESELAKQATFSKVKERALAELENLKPILPEDAKKAQRWKEKFIEEFKQFEYAEQDGNYIIMKDGKPVQDSHGYTKSFVDHVKETASDFFDFKKAEDRSNAGNKPPADPNKPFIAPKTQDEYVQMMRDAKTPEERIKIKESYINK